MCEGRSGLTLANEVWLWWRQDRTPTPICHVWMGWKLYIKQRKTAIHIYFSGDAEQKFQYYTYLFRNRKKEKRRTGARTG